MGFMIIQFMHLCMQLYTCYIHVSLLMVHAQVPYVLIWDRSVSPLDSTGVAGGMSQIISGKTFFITKDHELLAWI